MKPTTLFRSTLAALAVLATAPRASAQNHREMPIGGRTATMGGAGTAAGNDSAMPYLNPAGLAGVPGDIFAVSATVYSYTHRSFQNYFYPSGTVAALGFERDREDFGTTSIGELPSSVMYFRHLSAPTAHVQHKLGMSLVIPSARNVDLVASLAGRDTAAAGTDVRAASLTQNFRRYYIGPTYAVGIGRDLRIGLSVYAIYHRNSMTSTFTSSSTILGGTITSTINLQRSELDEALSIAPIAGIQARVASDLWVGFGVAAPSVGLAGRSRVTSETSGQTPDRTAFGTLATSSLTTLDADYRAATPLRLNAGLAWERRSGFSAAADVHVYLPRTDSETHGTQFNEERRAGDLTRHYRRRIDQETEAETTVDLSIGAEYAVNSVLALRGGFFTDLASAHAIIDDPLYVRQTRLDRYGGTVGVGLKLGSFDTTAGLLLARGSGQHGTVDVSVPGGRTVAAIETTETTGLLVLSGAVTIEAAKKTIRETLPFQTGPLPDLDGTETKPPAPWLPTPLPAEPKPPPPPLRHQPSPPPATP
jgi:hypothetical protein